MAEGSKSKKRVREAEVSQAEPAPSADDEFESRDDSAIRKAALDKPTVSKIRKAAPDSDSEDGHSPALSIIRQKQQEAYGFWLNDLGQYASHKDGPLSKEFRILWHMLRDGESANTIGGYDETALLRTQGAGLWFPLLLLRFGSDPNYRCKLWEKSYGGTILHIAARRGNVPLVVALLSAGANPAALDVDGDTPIAAAKKNAQRRLEEGPDMNPHIPFDRTGAAAQAISDFVSGERKAVDIHAGTLRQAYATISNCVRGWRKEDCFAMPNTNDAT